MVNRARFRIWVLSCTFIATVVEHCVYADHRENVKIDRLGRVIVSECLQDRQLGFSRRSALNGSPSDLLGYLNPSF
jgi:hypothetical protein